MLRIEPVFFVTRGHRVHNVTFEHLAVFCKLQEHVCPRSLCPCDEVYDGVDSCACGVLNITVSPRDMHDRQLFSVVVTILRKALYID